MRSEAEELKRLLQRTDRAFEKSSLGDVIASRKAIIGPRSDLLEKDARDARDLLLQGRSPGARQLAALEQVIRLQRPAPCCVPNGLTKLPDGGNWLEGQWTQFQPLLKRLQGSVARLERVDDPSPRLGTGRTSLGTGFLVAADTLLTASHVVDELSFGTRQLERGQAIADFQGYFGVGGKELREIIDVIALDSSLDLALLRIDPVEISDELRPVLIPTAEQLNTGQPVCVVGYPLEDPRNPRSFVSIIFENRFGVKRAAIGEITATENSLFFHDCSTLGGNSGGPVVDLASGQVCGIHVSGRAMMRNESVPGTLALDFVNRSLFEKTTTPKPVRSRPVQQNPRSSFSEYYQQLQESDAEIMKELTTAMSDMAVVESAASAEGQFQLETIVLTKGRPVLDIKDGTTVIEIEEVESQVWKQRLTDANNLIIPNIPAVGRIELHNHPRGIDWIGTGWIIRDNIIVTNRHVAEIFGELSGSEFVFRPGLDGTPMQAQIDFLEEFGNTNSHEYPVFQIVHIEPGGGPDLAFLRIEPVEGNELPQPVVISSTTVQPGEQVAVIGYPARDSFFPDQELMKRIFNDRYDKKRLAPGLITGKTPERVFHDCSTLGGNSGAEVISLKTGHAVALHFAGTLFSKNHAVPIEIVASKLDDALARHPKATGNAAAAKTDTGSAREVLNLQSAVTAATGQRFIDATIPIKIRVEIGDITTSTPATVQVTAPISQRRPAMVAPVVVADEDLIETSEAKPENYRDRKGYDPEFLGPDFVVPLPVLTENVDDILSFEFDGKTHTVLNYQHFSVQMSISRRMCRFSACNIDGKKSKKKPRTGWQFDPRIKKTEQIMKECYGNEPKFSRGHMTRREDPVWGTDLEATLGNSDSMHATNAVPQIQPFNAGVWLNLEDYALDNAREDDMKICVFTGPFLAKNDPFRFDVKIPITFWKVIAFINDETGKLCATGYTMSQKSFLTEQEFVFGQHEQHQRPIAEIERRAGISFGPLAELDPLREANESTPTLLTSPSQIRFF